MMDVSIVIVTYNSAGVIERCLSSVPRVSDVIVVDNASGDDSAARAKARGAEVIVNRTNIGFGAACNIGASAASAEFILFLNPDAVLAPDALQVLMDAARGHNAAAAGPRLLEDDGRPAAFQGVSFIEAQSGRSLKGSAAPVSECRVGFLSGAALLCRRDAFLGVGGFDERIFLYYEDDDLCERLKARGPLIYTPRAVVRHGKGRSSAWSLRGAYTRSRHMAESKLYVSRKHGVRLNTRSLARRAAMRLIRSAALLQIEKAARHLAALRVYTMHSGDTGDWAANAVLKSENAFSARDKRSEPV
jgi:GT2 family glycosyltransferase